MKQDTFLNMVVGFLHPNAIKRIPYTHTHTPCKIYIPCKSHEAH